MSRVGKSPITIPAGVTATITDNMITVVGPKGQLERELLPTVSAKVEENEIIISRFNDEKASKAQHGLTRALVNNMVEGVSQGFSKKLEVNGVGFKVNLAGKNLKLSLGFSHDIDYAIPEGVDIVVEQNNITVSGIDKQQVGQVAAEIREFKKPEPYKGKGIKYEGEHIIRKSGKTAGSGD
jgi:large subunit ribosomal protein L6